MTALFDFIVTERKHYTNKGGNLFASSLGEALRYYDFLLIIADRYKKIGNKMISISNKERKLTPSQTGDPFPMTDEQIRLMEEWYRLNKLIQLEIETFYLFAKILLDKIALFIENYFGQARGISLRSHDKWERNHEQYRLAKHLTYPQGFSDSIVFVKEHISDYRDKQISHLQSQRTVRATTWGRAKHMKIAAYHTKNGGQAHSRELPELIRAIDIYLQQVITLIESNRGKTRLELGKSGKSSKLIHGMDGRR